MEISHRANTIKPSPTLEITAKAAELRAKGEDVISLSAGEPDFDTPETIKQDAIKAIEAGYTKYTPVDGMPELKDAIINKLKRDNHLNYNKDNVLVSSGAKQCIYNLCQALLNPGDEAIIPCPYWVSYPDMVLLAEGKPVFIESTIDARFKITAEQLEQAISNKTKLIFLNTPNNPSGISYTKNELEKIGNVLKKHPHITIVSDDIYEKILWSSESFCNIATACPSLFNQTVVINGVSKAYAMTGWRIGYAAGPAELIKAMKKIQSQSTSNACSVSQMAAISALNGSEQPVHAMVHEFKTRHDYMANAINELPGLNCLSSDGAFYLFIDARQLIANMNYNNDIELAEYLLNSAHIALVPGTAFGLSGYLRLSYATSMEKLQETIKRLKKIIK